jgi:hypothetical protein
MTAQRRTRRSDLMQEPLIDRTLFIPDADKAIIGTFRRCGQPPVIAYDYCKLVEHFKKQGLSDEDAHEWIAVNIEGAWAGAGTPAIVHTEDEDA